MTAFVIEIMKMHSFTVGSGSRGYHLYKDSSWKLVHVNKPVAVQKKEKSELLQMDPFCCAMTITRPDKIGPVTVAHIPLEIS